nr:exocyst complex component exo84c [Quercus suber]
MQSHTSPNFSSVSTNRDDDDDSELQSMTGKVEIFKQVLVRYAIYIFEEVEGVENELVELKNHVLTPKKLVKELVDGIYLEFLSEDTIESIIEEPACIDSPQPSELDALINDVSETLDLLLSENKIDEALDIMDLKDENFQRLKFEGNTPSDVLMLYNSAICERKAMLTHHLTLVAENPRRAAPEL